MAPATKAVIFDLGNVLVDFDHRIASSKVAKFSDRSEEDIYNLIFDSPSTELFEEGKISPEDFFKDVKKTLNLSLSYEEFVPIWNEIFFFSERNLEACNIARLLKQSYRVALLSNINILHFEYVRETFPILDAFHDIITSFEVGARKPKKEIYEKTLDILEAKAPEAFYTDDRKELIKSAKDLGIKAHVFISPEQLKKDLKSEGITI
jgi:glucose-1-phosphatase